jgi:glycyl-tRNA synthetase beta subunit
VKIKDFKPMKAVVNLFNHHFQFDNSFNQQEANFCDKIRRFLAADPNARLNPENYVEMLSCAVQIADCCQSQAMAAQEIKNQRLTLNAQGYYVVKVI